MMTKTVICHALETLLVEDNGAVCPMVRLKSKMPETNPTGATVYLIRHHPLALGAEYSPAELQAGSKSLRQWHDAGIIKKYPRSERLYAERHTVRDVVDTVRAEHREARNDYFRYQDSKRVLSEKKLEGLDLHRANRRVAFYLDKLHVNNRIISSKRLILLSDLLSNGMVHTTPGKLFLYAAQVSALIDMLPQREFLEVPPHIRAELNDSRSDLRDPDPEVFVSLTAIKDKLYSTADDETEITLQRAYRILDKINAILNAPKPTTPRRDDAT